MRHLTCPDFGKQVSKHPGSQAAEVVRLLKLLRYFDSLRLLVDAAANSLEALPVLLYTMAPWLRLQVYS